MQPETTDRLSVGPDVVTVRRRGSSTHDVAHILGRESDHGVEVIYLDRVIHRYDGQSYTDAWQAQGAFVTELRRPLGGPAAQESR